jgi:YqjK-like protein
MRRRDRYAQIRARRERLIAKADLQREEFAREVTVWQPAIGVLDRALAGYAWIRAHPEILVAAGAVLLVLRPRRTLRWSLRLYSVWQTYRRFSAKLSAVAASMPASASRARAQGTAGPAG